LESAALFKAALSAFLIFPEPIYYWGLQMQLENSIRMLMFLILRRQKLLNA